MDGPGGKGRSLQPLRATATGRSGTLPAETGGEADGEDRCGGAVVDRPGGAGQERLDRSNARLATLEQRIHRATDGIEAGDARLKAARERAERIAASDPALPESTRIALRLDLVNTLNGVAEDRRRAFYDLALVLSDSEAMWKDKAATMNDMLAACAGR